MPGQHMSWEYGGCGGGSTFGDGSDSSLNTRICDNRLADVQVSKADPWTARFSVGVLDWCGTPSNLYLWGARESRDLSVLQGSCWTANSAVVLDGWVWEPSSVWCYSWSARCWTCCVCRLSYLDSGMRVKAFSSTSPGVHEDMAQKLSEEACVDGQSARNGVKSYLECWGYTPPYLKSEWRDFTFEIMRWRNRYCFSFSLVARACEIDPVLCCLLPKISPMCRLQVCRRSNSDSTCFSGRMDTPAAKLTVAQSWRFEGDETGASWKFVRKLIRSLENPITVRIAAQACRLEFQTPKHFAQLPHNAKAQKSHRQISLRFNSLCLVHLLHMMLNFLLQNCNQRKIMLKATWNQAIVTLHLVRHFEGLRHWRLRTARRLW